MIKIDDGFNLLPISLTDPMNLFILITLLASPSKKSQLISSLHTQPLYCVWSWLCLLLTSSAVIMILLGFAKKSKSLLYCKGAMQ